MQYNDTNLSSRACLRLLFHQRFRQSVQKCYVLYIRLNVFFGAILWGSQHCTVLQYDKKYLRNNMRRIWLLQPCHFHYRLKLLLTSFFISTLNITCLFLFSTTIYQSKIYCQTKRSSGVENRDLIYISSAMD